MYREAMKMHLIEEVIKVDNESILNKLETVLKRSKKQNTQKSIYDFVGVLSDKDAKQMKKAIKETCEIILENDWK